MMQVGEATRKEFASNCRGIKKLPSSIGIMMKPWKESLLTNQDDSWKVVRGDSAFVGLEIRMEEANKIMMDDNFNEVGWPEAMN